MKAKLMLSFTLLAFFTTSTFAFGDVSFKYIKKRLKKDNSPASNERLADEVLNRGIKFLYTPKRDAELRRLGANDMLIRAIYTAEVEETQEASLSKSFFKHYDNDKKDRRKRAYEKGKLYIMKFEKRKRFAETFARIKKEWETLACEFDFERGC